MAQQLVLPRWKVFNVICVEGSPTDWAAMLPTASPGAQIADPNIEATSFPRAADDKLLLFIALSSLLSVFSAEAVALASRSETQAPLVPNLWGPFEEDNSGSATAGLMMVQTL